MKGTPTFEQSLKDALEHYEVPYNSADWSKLEQRLGRPKNGAWQASAGLYMLLAAGSLAVATTLHVLFTEEPNKHGAGFGVLIPAAEESEDHAAWTSPAQPSMAEPRTNEPLAAVTHDTEHTSQSGLARTNSKRSNGQGGAVMGETPVPEPVSPATMLPPANAEKAIRPSVTEGCPGTTVQFQMENLPEDGIHLWNFGDGSFSNKAKPSHTYYKSGSFEVMLSHSSLHGGNFSNRPASDRIVIHEAPEAAFQHILRKYPNTVPSVHFENHSLHGKQYRWDLGDGNTSTTAHPDHVYKKKGDYTVSLTVTNEKGCVDRSEKTVRIAEDYDLLAPKTFSPNDDGVNDVFIPEALRDLKAKFHLAIFHAGSGHMVYETTDAGRPWNGRVNNKGDKCAPGEYVWVVEMAEKLGGTYTGRVNLVR